MDFHLLGDKTRILGRPVRPDVAAISARIDDATISDILELTKTNPDFVNVISRDQVVPIGNQGGHRRVWDQEAIGALVVLQAFAQERNIPLVELYVSRILTANDAHVFARHLNELSEQINQGDTIFERARKTPQMPSNQPELGRLVDQVAQYGNTNPSTTRRGAVAMFCTLEAASGRVFAPKESTPADVPPTPPATP